MRTINHENQYVPLIYTALLLFFMVAVAACQQIEDRARARVSAVTDSIAARVEAKADSVVTRGLTRADSVVRTATDSIINKI
jgi:hypothetical protein